MENKSNRRFRPEFYKFFTWIEHSTHPCTNCEGVLSELRRPGNVFVQKVNPSVSIDGEDAHRVYFVCDGCKHMNFVGFTKPVDFEKNLGKAEWDMSAPAYDASDDEWEEWAAEQQRQDWGSNDKAPGSGLILTPY